MAAELTGETPYVSAEVDFTSPMVYIENNTCVKFSYFSRSNVSLQVVYDTNNMS